MVIYINLRMLQKEIEQWSLADVICRGSMSRNMHHGYAQNLLFTLLFGLIEEEKLFFLHNNPSKKLLSINHL